MQKENQSWTRVAPHAWFVNAMLLNVKTLTNELKKDKNTLIKKDKFIITKILTLHSEAPIEHLLLETGTTPF